MLSFSAKTVTLSARPSPSVSSQTTILSRPLAGGLQLVRVVDRQRGPQPAALVPGHADRLAAAAPSRSTNSFDLGTPSARRCASCDSSAGSGFCILLSGSPSCPTARRPGSSGSSADVDVLERLHVGPLRRSSPGPGTAASNGDAAASPATGRVTVGRVLADGPADAALDQVLEAGVAPRPLVVAPGGVEDAALALRPHPRPRLLPVAARRGTSRTVRSFSLCLVWT